MHARAALRIAVLGTLLAFAGAPAAHPDVHGAIAAPADAAASPDAHGHPDVHAGVGCMACVSGGKIRHLLRTTAAATAVPPRVPGPLRAPCAARARAPIRISPAPPRAPPTFA